MGAAAGVDVDALKAENERLRAQVAELQASLDEATAKVRQLELKNLSFDARTG